MSLRQQKRILQKVEAELGETVRSFLLSVPQGCSPAKAEEKYQHYNVQWRDYCRKMNKRHKWLKADAEAFTARVTLLNRTAERKLKPLQYYGKRLALPLAAAAIIWLLTDVVLPYFNITNYQLFNN